MSVNPYPVAPFKNTDVYEFQSVGVKTITKLVWYSQTEEPMVYNLAMGDYKSKKPYYGQRLSNRNLDVLVASNNGDRDKVMLTTFLTMIMFTNRYPDRFILFYGSTIFRTRLYQMGIASNLALVQQYFDVFGNQNGTWEAFMKGVSYNAFLFNRK